MKYKKFSTKKLLCCNTNITRSLHRMLAGKGFLHAACIAMRLLASKSDICAHMHTYIYILKRAYVYKLQFHAIYAISQRFPIKKLFRLPYSHHRHSFVAAAMPMLQSFFVPCSQPMPWLTTATSFTCLTVLRSLYCIPAICKRKLG